MCSLKYLANIMVLLSDAFWRNYKSSLFSMLQLWAGGFGMRQKIDKSADEQFIKFPLTALSAELRGLRPLCGAQLFWMPIKLKPVESGANNFLLKLLLIGKMCLGSEKRSKKFLVFFGYQFFFIFQFNCAT